MLRNRRIILSLLIGIVFSGITLYLSFQRIPLGQLMDYLRTINYWWIIPSIFISFLSIFVRALRWQIILTPVRRIGFWHAFHPLVIAFTINCILPGRVGELARPAILYKRDRVEFSKGLATVGAERILDAFTLLVLFITILGSVNISPDITIPFDKYQLNRDTLKMIWGNTLRVSIVLIILIIMISIPAIRNVFARLIGKLPHILFLTHFDSRKRSEERLHKRSILILDNLANGFEVLKNPLKAASCLGLSFIVWLLMCSSFYILILGCPGIRLSFLETSAVFIIICFFIMLPSVPGFWGLWEAGGIFGLMIFKVPAVEAAGITLTFHVFQIIPLMFLGIISALVTGINIVKTTYRLDDNSQGSELN
jgi:uncharacterized protein (TIRG00374 family)